MTTEAPPRSCPNCHYPLPTRPDPGWLQTETTGTPTTKLGRTLGYIVAVALTLALLLALAVGAVKLIVWAL